VHWAYSVLWSAGHRCQWTALSTLEQIDPDHGAIHRSEVHVSLPYRKARYADHNARRRSLSRNSTPSPTRCQIAARYGCATTNSSP
jgi:hypothetical protein